MSRFHPGRGFTLVELLVALVVLSVLALVSYRGLAAVLDARTHVTQETAKWRRIAAFSNRFEQDLRLAAPRPVRTVAGALPAWLGRPGSTPGPRLEFSRFASSEDTDLPRRVGYMLNDRQEIELWVWPGLDLPPDTQPARYPMLRGIARFDIEYLDATLAWVDAWPAAQRDTALPRAVRLRIVPAGGEEIVRIFALNS
jgi:general secretion pathway protein J